MMNTDSLEQSRATVLASKGTRGVEVYESCAAARRFVARAAEAFADDELPDRRLFPVYEGEKCGEIVLLNGRLVSDWSDLKIPGSQFPLLSKELHAVRRGGVACKSN